LHAASRQLPEGCLTEERPERLVVTEIRQQGHGALHVPLGRGPVAPAQEVDRGDVMIIRVVRIQLQGPPVVAPRIQVAAAARIPPPFHGRQAFQHRRHLGAAERRAVQTGRSLRQHPGPEPDAAVERERAEGVQVALPRRLEGAAAVQPEPRPQRPALAPFEMRLGVVRIHAPRDGERLHRRRLPLQHGQQAALLQLQVGQPEPGGRGQQEQGRREADRMKPDRLARPVGHGGAQQRRQRIGAGQDVHVEIERDLNQDGDERPLGGQKQALLDRPAGRAHAGQQQAGQHHHEADDRRGAHQSGFCQHLQIVAVREPGLTVGSGRAVHGEHPPERARSATQNGVSQEHGRRRPPNHHPAADAGQLGFGGRLAQPPIQRLQAQLNQHAADDHKEQHAEPEHPAAAGPLIQPQQPHHPHRGEQPQPRAA